MDELLAQGNSVVGLDNLRNGKKENLESAIQNDQFKFIEGDILNEDDVRVGMTEKQVENVIDRWLSLFTK